MCALKLQMHTVYSDVQNLKTRLSCKTQLLNNHTYTAGVYLYGNVGSGKSLLMDMFYSVIIEHNLVPNKRRMHFNAAMLEVQNPQLQFPAKHEHLSKRFSLICIWSLNMRGMILPLHQAIYLSAV